MITLMLAVNDRNGNMTNSCDRIDVDIDGDLAMQIECDELHFAELDDHSIRVGDTTLPYDFCGSMVGNVFWNAYAVFSDDVIPLLNSLKSELGVGLLEAWQPLWDKWHSDQPYTVADFTVAEGESS